MTPIKTADQGLLAALVNNHKQQLALLEQLFGLEVENQQLACKLLSKTLPDGYDSLQEHAYCDEAGQKWWVQPRAEVVPYSPQPRYYAEVLPDSERGH